MKKELSKADRQDVLLALDLAIARETRTVDDLARKQVPRNYTEAAKSDCTFRKIEGSAEAGTGGNRNQARTSRIKH